MIFKVIELNFNDKWLATLLLVLPMPEMRRSIVQVEVPNDLSPRQEPHLLGLGSGLEQSC
jgi:hypothetical protein